MLRFVLLPFLLSCCPTLALSAPFDWSAFDQFLKSHVVQGNYQGIEANLVDYPALVNDQSFLQIADSLNRYNPAPLSANEKLAFYINAYNYFAIKIVVDNWPVKKSIKDIGSLLRPVWKKTVGHINGEPVTLDEIEHAILRPMGEPRIHFAIVCASMSCPDLRTEIYNAEQLDAQLDDQVSVFLANNTKGAIIKKDTLYLSEIFDWFGEDFAKSGGVIAFVSHYQPRLGNFKDFETIDYNWQLNRIRQ